VSWRQGRTVRPEQPRLLFGLQDVSDGIVEPFWADAPSHFAENGIQHLLLMLNRADHNQQV
jgi:hypothetical protein